MSAPTEPPPFPQGRGGQALSLSGRSILIVEDESLVALLLQDAVEAAGGSVIGPCYSLAECLALARTETFDAAVLDVDLAGEDVFPAAEELERRGIPFLFHTAHADRDELKARFGDVSLCRKPTRMRELVAELSRILGSSRPS